MYLLTIETKQDSDADGKKRKGRSFRAIKLAHIEANAFWEGGQAQGDEVRPVWMMIAGTPAELRPFVMNLRRGSRADLSVAGASERYSRSKPTRFGVLKSAGYLYESQQLSDGSEAVTIFLPELCTLDPGMIDPHRCQFLCLTPVWWQQEQLRGLLGDGSRCQGILSHIRALTLPVALSDDAVLALTPLAVRVAAYVEARTRRPIPTEPAFSLQLFFAGLDAGILSLAATDAARQVWRHRYARIDRQRAIAESSDPWLFGRHEWAATFTETDTAEVGMLPGVLCAATHAQLDGLLASEVATFYAAQAAL